MKYTVNAGKVIKETELSASLYSFNYINPKNLLVYIYLNPINLYLLEEYYTIIWLTKENTTTANIRLNYSFGFCNEDTNVVVIMSTEVKKEMGLSIHPKIVNMNQGIYYLN